jgi:hypothetical protein
MFSIIRSGFFLLALLALAIAVNAQISPAVPVTTAAISGQDRPAPVRDRVTTAITKPS